MKDLGVWQSVIIGFAEVLTGLNLVAGKKLTEVENKEGNPEYLKSQGWERHVRGFNSQYFEVLRKEEDLVEGWFSSETVTASATEREVLYRVLCPTFIDEPITIECLDDNPGGY